MLKDYDVIISGSGPSGSLLGYLLAKKGINSLIVEKKVFPRFKVCAGGIQHRILNLLPFNINPVIEKSISGIYFSLKNKDIFYRRYDSPFIYTTDRAKFDKFLADHAQKAGCNINFGEKTLNIDAGPDNVELLTDMDNYNAKIVVGADGLGGAVHTKLAGKNRIRKILCYDAELYYKKGESLSCKEEMQPRQKKYITRDKKGNVFDLSDSVRLDFNGVKKGYCWVFPKKERFSLGTGAQNSNAKALKNYFHFFLDNFYGYDCNDRNNLKIFAKSIPIRYKNTPVKNNRLLAIGDAACLGDGFTGEGLYNCFRSAYLAADSIEKALKHTSFDFDDYEQNINNDIFRDIQYSLILKEIYFNSLFIFYNMLKKNDNYFNSSCKVLRGEKTYKDVINRLNIFKIAK